MTHATLCNAQDIHVKYVYTMYWFLQPLYMVKLHAALCLCMQLGACIHIIAYTQQTHLGFIYCHTECVCPWLRLSASIWAPPSLPTNTVSIAYLNAASLFYKGAKIHR